MQSPVTPILAELERAYSFFNARLFGGLLPWKVAICLDTSVASRCLGYFSGSRWHQGGTTLHQISLSTAAIGRGAEFALEFLLHEMVHLWNHLLKLKDVSGGNQYHNQHFRDAALLFGLECPRFNNQRGYSATRLSARGTAMVREFRPDEAAFKWKIDVFRRVPIGTGE